MLNLSLEKLCRIINDITPTDSGLLCVGVVGSYARNDHTSFSDIDLVFSMEKDCIDDVLYSIGMRLKSILINQFRVELDIINYDNILKSLEEPQVLTRYQLEGYNQMLKDLTWIWKCKKE